MTVVGTSSELISSKAGVPDLHCTVQVWCLYLSGYSADSCVLQMYFSICRQMRLVIGFMILSEVALQNLQHSICFDSDDFADWCCLGLSRSRL